MVKFLTASVISSLVSSRWWLLTLVLATLPPDTVQGLCTEALLFLVSINAFEWLVSILVGRMIV